MFACVKEGKPLGSIHIPAWAQPHEEFAARELARYIRKSTGAEMPIVPSLKRVARGDIVLADLSHAAASALLPPRIGQGLRHDGFRMRTVKGALYVVSNEAGGVVFGAYEYLRIYVGCCFLDRRESGESVPAQKTIRHADVAILDNPRIQCRSLMARAESYDKLHDRVDWMAKNGFSHLQMVTYSSPLWEDTLGWENGCRDWLMPELKQRGLKLALGHHTFGVLLPKDQFLAERPEFFAKIEGKRVETGQLNWCLSNEELIETVTDAVIRTVRENPDADTFQLWPDDGNEPACECRNCAALDDPRDAEATDWPNVYGQHPSARRGNRTKMRRYLHLANRVAERLAKVYPKVRLNVISYADITDPPVGVSVHPNIIVCLAIYWRCSHHNLYDPKCPVNRQYQACIRGWLELVPAESLVFYDYYMGMYSWASLPYPTLTNLFSEWDTQAEMGLRGSLVQSFTGHLAVYGINYIAFARLAREKYPTLDEFLDNYCRDFFGPAAEPIAEVYRTWEKTMQTGGHHMVSAVRDAKRVFSAASVKTCRKLVDQALAATDDPLYRWRVERIGALVEYVQLWREVPGDLLFKTLAGDKVSAGARNEIDAWVRRLDDFVTAHRALDDGIFAYNPADLLRRYWLEKV